MNGRQEGTTQAAPDERVAHESPPTVPARAIRDGETAGLPEKWSWVEPTIWTLRMVQALVNGVKGGVWYSLWDKVITPRAREVAFTKVKANDGAAGVDHVSIQAFERDEARHLKALHEALRSGTYRPSAIRRTYIPKAGSSELRPLGIPTVRDRVVQTVLRRGIEPIFEREFAEHSYGSRPRRNALQAIDRVEQLLCAGNVWTVDVDLKSYFDTVPHTPLLALVRERVADGRVLGLIEARLTQPVADGERQWIPTVGTTQGASISSLRANLYLTPLDPHMAGAGFERTRSVDDFVIQCRTEEDAQRARAEVERGCGLAGRTVHPSKTRVVWVSRTEGFDFLGYHFRQHRDGPGRYRTWPRTKSVAKLRETLRPLTKRTSGHSLTEIVRLVNLVVRGFVQHFRKSVLTSLRPIDSWIRGRLRSILRRRSHRRGRARGDDHTLWPNALFEERGLFSMAGALAKPTHSPRG